MTSWGRARGGGPGGGERLMAGGGGGGGGAALANPALVTPAMRKHDPGPKKKAAQDNLSEAIRLHRARFVPWNPKPVAALAAADDGSAAAAARDGGAVEVFETQHWATTARGFAPVSVLSLAFVEGRLFAGTVGARIYEFDAGTRRLARPTDSRGGAVWGLAAEP